MKLSRRKRVIEQLRKMYNKGQWKYSAKTGRWINNKVGSVEVYFHCDPENGIKPKYLQIGRAHV